MEKKERPITELVEKIAKEAQEATATQWDVTRIIKELSKEETKNIEELREKTIKLLEQLNPKAATIYASFHRLRVHTSSQEVQPFDRGNIIKSLLKETDVSRAIAEKIGSEVEDKIKDLKISFLTTALIREMVNVKLLEYGYERIRNQYTRLGLPVFEAGKKIEKGFYGNEDVLTEYNLLRVLPKKLVEMHFNSDIFIADIGFFNQKPFAGIIEPEKKQGLEETVFASLSKVARAGKYFSIPPCLNALNIYLGEFAKTKKRGKEIAEFFFKAAEVLENGFCIGLNLFLPDELEEFSEKKEKAFSLASAFLETGGKSKVEEVVVVDSKYRLKLLNKKILEGNLNVLNCKNKQLYPLGRGLFTEKKGISSFTGLNIPKIALQNKGKETAFFNSLQEKIEAIKELAKLKRELLEKRNYLKKTIELQETQDAIGIAGLAQASSAFIQEEKGKEVAGFAEKTLEALKKELSGWLVLELRDRSALERFAKENKKLGLEEPEKTKEVIVKKFDGLVKAENKKQLNELLDGNASIIRLEQA